MIETICVCVITISMLSAVVVIGSVSIHLLESLYKKIKLHLPAYWKIGEKCHIWTYLVCSHCGYEYAALFNRQPQQCPRCHAEMGVEQHDII